MNAADTGNHLFPVFLKVDKLRVLMVGGGDAGSEKLRFLLKSSPFAKVTLVAPEISDEINTLAMQYPHVTLVHRGFRSEDLEGEDVVIVATENPKLNRQIWEQAKKKRILVNVADTPELCDFYLGSIVTKGDLKIAISTNGKSPTFAKRFREFLEDTLPDDLQQVIDNLSQIRRNLKGDFAQKVKALNELTSNLVSKHG
ncbi:MAG TPA: bifunctional precorrin-2 dehydrogenase/sirohydrochlorin ferrochelatase [Chitinophagales bacterium]|nr:bifunctional precorrin-2 dehydrogenase/sirohydrochlorin ferrochelatase [Chitinophagales bacterium]